MLILGLAPAAHGANRTGRVFTGDGVGASGDFLMAALKRAGFANIATSQRIDDGLALTDAYIAAAVRCAPPANKPLPEEVDRCLPHLVERSRSTAPPAGRRRPRQDRVGCVAEVADDARYRRCRVLDRRSRHGAVVDHMTASTLVGALSPVAAEHEHRRGHAEDVCDAVFRTVRESLR